MRAREWILTAVSSVRGGVVPPITVVVDTVFRSRVVFIFAVVRVSDSGGKGWNRPFQKEGNEGQLGGNEPERRGGQIAVVNPKAID